MLFKEYLSSTTFSYKPACAQYVVTRKRFENKDKGEHAFTVYGLNHLCRLTIMIKENDKDR
jgi:predicted SprT family Zn-dependent metalloprotease